MRPIDADKLYPDCRYQKETDYGLAITQSQIANASTLNVIVIPEGATKGEVLDLVFKDLNTKDNGFMVQDTEGNWMSSTCISGPENFMNWRNEKYER